VSELQVEGELINFSIPGSVAPWKQETSNIKVREITLFNFTVNIWNRTLIYVIGSVPVHMVVGLVAGWWIFFHGLLIFHLFAVVIAQRKKNVSFNFLPLLQD